VNKKLIFSSLIIFILSFVITSMASQAFAETKCDFLSKSLPGIYEIRDHGTLLVTAAVRKNSDKYSVSTVEKVEGKAEYRVIREGIETGNAESPRRPNVALKVINQKCVVEWQDAEVKSPVLNYVYKVFKNENFILAGETEDEFYEVIRFNKIASIGLLK
jgi:hypothetical protein